MSLEFNQIVNQVYKMGSMLEKLDFDLSESLDEARLLYDGASDLEAAWQRTDWVREKDISGYRGALPLSEESGVAEPVNATFPEPDVPKQATILAADGGQIYPNERSAVHYYLLNIGLFSYPHGQNDIPVQQTIPTLKFHKADVHDRYGHVIRNRVVDDRRTVEEMRLLAKSAWDASRSGAVQPIVALYDNRLLFVPGDNIRRNEDLLGDYLKGMRHLYDSGATLAGYLDNPRGRRVVQLLYLLSIESFEELKEKQSLLSQAGAMDGLLDKNLFQSVLKPGERSAIMVQNSPRNQQFIEKQGQNMEIAFFYLKVANTIARKTESNIVRVDIPMWVARDKQRVDALHALLLHQCRLQGRNPYPYALTRADELAYIGGKDRAKMQELVNEQIRRSTQRSGTPLMTGKSRGKDLARSDKRYHTMWGDIDIDSE